MTTTDLPQVLDEMHSYIRRAIAAGFETPEQIVEGVFSYLEDQADPELLRPHAERMVGEVLEQHLRDQMEWPSITDCDRLDLAFALLERAGVVCRQNFTCCGSCGSAEIGGEIEVYESAGGRARGYAFFHQQDTDSAVEDGGGLYLAYGAVEDGEEVGVAIGRAIEAALQQYGLETSWSGQLSQRIFVRLNWQRRRLEV
ncbi:MAG TPA: hypothetical protein VFS21_20890 [Roseiflexaceae bacterium]|nr:hypothetical protein [Roseiflexaceae bacterium]